MVELATVLKVTSLSLSVAKYTGIIQDQLKLKVDQLAGSELEAGCRALQQAANSDAEETTLLREARARFNKAISLEVGFRLAAAQLGLALCHSSLGDTVNAQKAVSELVQIVPPEISVLLKAGRALNDASWSSLLLAGPLALQVAPLKLLVAPSVAEQHKALEEGIASFVALQQEAQRTLDRSLREGSENVFGLVKTNS